MSFIHENFLLSTPLAVRLFHEVARDLPIIDYHCHLPPQDVAVNRRFRNLYDIWLAGDHYKWRAMRTNGVPERFCTGDAPEYDKFLAWARTVPHTLRNPLYHWSHLELKRYFGIDTLLDERTAPAVWEQANARLADPDLSAHGILRRFRVSVIGTTDDPTDSLEHHRAIAASGIGTRVYPTYRPDKALQVDQPALFNPWIERLAAVSGCDCSTLEGLLDALRRRHDFFHEHGARLSDHGLERCYAVFPSETEASIIFQQARAGQAASPEQKEKFAAHLMLHFGRWAAERGWTMQLHLGPMRNNSTRLFRALGPDIGCDSIGDFPQGQALSRFLDRLDQDGLLPKTVLYNINPADNYLFATMLGNFQDGSLPGKVQWGSGWWFLDQKEAMQWQLNALSNLGLLSHYVGMLTDSRSFLSYCRHEYFRRILCNLLARDVAAGELPDDYDLLAGLVRRISYENASRYFGFVLGQV